MLDVRRLDVLVAAVREGSLAGAARSLNLTPSAVSQAVGALEAGVGRQLLVRHGRGVRPTEAGHRLALRSQGILADLLAAEDEAVGRRQGALVLAAPPTVVAGLVPQAVTLLARENPDLVLTVIETERRTARDAVLTGDVDLAVVDHHVDAGPEHDPRLVALTLADEPVDVWLPLGHRSIDSPSVELSDLRNDGWVVSPPLSACFDLLARACAGAGFGPKIVATCAEYRSVARLVEAGLGVAIAPRLALAATTGTTLVARPTIPPVSRRLTMLLRPGDRSPGVRALVAALQRATVEV